MTIPASPLQLTADDIWNEFVPPTLSLYGTITGTSPNWTLVMSFGSDLSAYIGYKIREPAPGGRIGTITGQSFTPGYYGIGTGYVYFTMAGSQPSDSSLFTTGTKYLVYPARSSSVGLSSYYAGGALVPTGTYGYPSVFRSFIPSSGTIGYNNFRGAFKITTLTVSTYYGDTNSGVASIYLTPGTWKIMTRLQGGGGGGGGPDGAQGGSGGGDGLGLVASFQLTVTTYGYVTIYAGGAGGAGYHAGPGAVSNGGTSAAVGTFGGAYDSIFKGGNGGSPGSSGSSGTGGGGGGASCLMWTPDNNNTNSKILLALAGGGGGGSGAGQRSNIVGFTGTVAWPNYRNRYACFDITTLTTLNQEYDTFTGVVGGSAYRLAGYNSDGQGWTTMTHYYPPGNQSYAGYDGGAGGGGGAGNGYGGGLSGGASGGNVWTNYKGTWYPANEFCGEGGGQGFAFINSTYYTSPYYNYSSGIGSASTYGSGYGAGGAVSYNANPGGVGAAWLKATTDLYDSSYP